MIVAIVQARLGSTRLPGKTLMDIGGKPMLDHVLDRLAKCDTLDKVVVATTTEPRDDAIVKHCQARGTTVHRGPEDDVLTRYLLTAEAEQADVIVRVTSDCPLIDPGIVDQVVRALGDHDYASNVMEPRTFPRGLDAEAFTMDALRQADEEDKSSWREHVTPYLYRSGKFSAVPVTQGENQTAHRWTVDTPEDIALMRAVVAELGPWATSQAILAAWRPEWTMLNASVTQKDV